MCLPFRRFLFVYLPYRPHSQSRMPRIFVRKRLKIARFRVYVHTPPTMRRSPFYYEYIYKLPFIQPIKAIIMIRIVIIKFVRAFEVLTKTPQKPMHAPAFRCSYSLFVTHRFAFVIFFRCKAEPLLSKGNFSGNSIFMPV